MLSALARRSSYIPALGSSRLRSFPLPTSQFLTRNLSTQSVTKSPQFKKPFDKILIANRGEIACRIIRTARKLGIKSVAVYSDADASALHVRMADEAYWIGGNSSSDSYLRMDRILDVCKKSGAQAVHPGYGFLSENSQFVELLEKNDIVFIGPPSGPMEDMGDKINSKRIAKEAGCYVIPGYEGEVRDADHAVELASQVGYPVMLKASAGGGGKGMRVAYNDAEVREGFALSTAEARSSFGDDRMLIERFIENPHHIEIQVIADAHGNVAAFPERECSVQRRNQKVVEESPSCLLTPETRKLMQQQAIALCKATGYRSAGTVEMLADDQQNFYFLEMNTRLQVEHPITELVSGEDLVEHMLYVAAGEKLPERLIKNPHVPFKGSAIECRVYAEDPLRGFLPSIGPLVDYREPNTEMSLNGLQTRKEGDGIVRVDSGVYEGGSISMYYDPMISKLCTYAKTREQSISLMEQALDRYVVQGLGNNLTFLRSVCRNKKFRSGNYSTKFIGEEYPEGFGGVDLTKSEQTRFIALGTAFHAAMNEDQNQRKLNQRMEGKSKGYGEEFAPLMEMLEKESESDVVEDDFAEAARDVVVVVLGGSKGKAYAVATAMQETLTALIAPMDGQIPDLSQVVKVELSDLEWLPGQSLGLATFSDDSETVRDSSSHVQQEAVQYLSNSSQKKGQEGFVLRYRGSEQHVIVRTPLEHKLHSHMLAPETKDVTKSLVCPMPGTLISCSVKEGDSVELGQQLAVVEAMKMQNVLRAERAGVVKKINKKAGSSLKVDEVILQFE